MNFLFFLEKNVFPFFFLSSLSVLLYNSNSSVYHPQDHVQVSLGKHPSNNVPNFHSLLFCSLEPPGNPESLRAGLRMPVWQSHLLEPATHSNCMTHGSPQPRNPNSKCPEAQYSQMASRLACTYMSSWPHSLLASNKKKKNYYSLGISSMQMQCEVIP